MERRRVYFVAHMGGKHPQKWMVKIINGSKPGYKMDDLGVPLFFGLKPNMGLIIKR